MSKGYSKIRDPFGPPPVKPEKPTPTFPLYAHRSGTWAKKIRGKLYYFGPWADPQAALDRYNREKEDLHAGRLPREREETGALTVYLLTAKFLTWKMGLRDSGELSPRTFTDYAEVCKLLLKRFGRNRLVSDLGPDDFEKLRAELTAKWGLVRVGNVVNRVRTIFTYAEKQGLLPKRMVYGEGFRRPSLKSIRKERQAGGPKMFEAAELRAMLGKATQPLRTMLLLAVNGGMGNSDVGNLPLVALDLDGGWLNFARVKTAIDRRIPLWPETVASLREWLAERPAPKDRDHADLVFLTQRGLPWAKDIADSPVTKETRKLLDALGIGGHRNFYCCRHTFQTIADECGDFIAVRKIMGHASADIADAYRERVSDERLLKVTNFVRGWLFAEPASQGEEPDVLPLDQARKQA